MKRLLVVFLSLCLVCCSNLSISVLAQGNENEVQLGEIVRINGMEVNSSEMGNYKEGEFEIVLSNKRIAANGEFIFSINHLVTSNSFTVSKDTITIQVEASIINPYGEDITDEYPGHRYKVELCKDNLWKTVVGSDEFDADGYLHQFTITGLSTDTSYFLRITNLDELPSGTEVTGDGYVSNVATVEG